MTSNQGYNVNQNKWVIFPQKLYADCFLLGHKERSLWSSFVRSSWNFLVTMSFRRFAKVDSPAAFKARFPLGEFVRATRSENKNPATWLVKIGWRKNSPRTSRKRSYFFVCLREQIRLVENGLKTSSLLYCGKNFRGPSNLNSFKTYMYIIRKNVMK